MVPCQHCNDRKVVRVPYIGGEIACPFCTVVTDPPDLDLTAHAIPDSDDAPTIPAPPPLPDDRPTPVAPVIVTPEARPTPNYRAALLHLQPVPIPSELRRKKE